MRAGDGSLWRGLGVLNFRVIDKAGILFGGSAGSAQTARFEGLGLAVSVGSGMGASEDAPMACKSSSLSGSPSTRTSSAASLTNRMQIAHLLRLGGS